MNSLRRVHVLVAVLALAVSCLLQPGSRGQTIQPAPTAAEVEEARLAYRRAFAHYTRLVTSDVKGDVKQALAEYTRAYARYEEIKRLAAAASQRGTAAPSSKPVGTPAPQPPIAAPAPAMPPAPAAAPAPLPMKGSAGGFDFDTLPPAADEQTASLTAQGGIVRLKDGAQVTFPPGALSAGGPVIFRRLDSSSPDRTLYHIAAPVERLAVPARIDLPVRAPDNSPVRAVDVFHFHDAADAGRPLNVQWSPGETTARVEIEELSVLGMTIVYGGFIYLGGSEAILQTQANTPDYFEMFARAAVNASSRKSARLKVPLYDQHFPETLWCWASSMSAVVQAGQMIDEYLETPMKPQGMAAMGQYDRTGWAGAGPSGLHWWDNRVVRWGSEKIGGFNPLEQLKQMSSSGVEGRSFTKFSYFASYMVAMLDAGYPVILDIRARTHTVNIVGYDVDGVWVQDPSGKPPQPAHWTWQFLLKVINSGSTSFVNNYVITTVVQKDLRAIGKTISLNAPSCEWGSGNRNGIYITAPTDRAYGGFVWDGHDSSGLRFSACGTTTGAPERLQVLPVGATTKVGFLNLEIGNTGNAAVHGIMRIALVQASGPQTVLEVPGLTAEAGQVSLHSSAPAEGTLLQAMPPDAQGPAAYELRCSLLVGGREVDRVNMPVVLRPFRLDSATTMAESGQVIHRLKGAGFGLRGDITLMAGPGGNEDRSFRGLKVLSDTEAEFLPDNRLSDPWTLFKEATVYLKILPPAGQDDPFTDNLETNRLAIAAPAGSLTIFVGKTFEEMGRPDNPYQTEADPVPGAEVRWTYRPGPVPVTRTARADERGMVTVPDVPLDMPITITFRGETKTVTCTRLQPQQFVTFGWEGISIKPVPVVTPPRNPDVVIPPPPH